tara:strand:+ start:667 stop:963 length:297 start_codon:yes stop_codon:yes gene_type:complete
MPIKTSFCRPLYIIHYIIRRELIKVLFTLFLSSSDSPKIRPSDITFALTVIINALCLSNLAPGHLQEELHLAVVATSVMSKMQAAGILVPSLAIRHQL